MQAHLYYICKYLLGLVIRDLLATKDVLNDSIKLHVSTGAAMIDQQICIGEVAGVD